MKTKNAKPKQKQRHQLIFKYLKSITPFNPNPQTGLYLQKLRGKVFDLKQPEMLLTSRVYDINIATATKNKKRVSFADVQVGNNPTIKDNNKGNVKSNKEDVTNSSQNNYVTSKEKYCSPQQVQKELTQLQNSVFSIFKIKADQPKYQNINHSNTFLSDKMKLGLSTDKDYSQQNQKNGNTSRFNEPQTQRTYSASTFSRPKIQSQIKPKVSISQLKVQSQIKQIYKPLVQSKVNYSKSQTALKPSQISKITQSKNPQILSPTLSKIQTVASINNSGLTRSLSDTKQHISSSIQRQYSNRSSIYSQQSHNLMVQIFKHKLKTKIG